MTQSPRAPTLISPPTLALIAKKHEIADLKFANRTCDEPIELDLN